jgi:hypothetical protein
MATCLLFAANRHIPELEARRCGSCGVGQIWRHAFLGRSLRHQGHRACSFTSLIILPQPVAAGLVRLRPGALAWDHTTSRVHYVWYTRPSGAQIDLHVIVGTSSLKTISADLPKNPSPRHLSAYLASSTKAHGRRPFKPAAQAGPTQPRSLPGLSRPAGSWAVLAATWVGSTTPEPPSSTLSTWGSAQPAP